MKSRFNRLFDQIISEATVFSTFYKLNDIIIATLITTNGGQSEWVKGVTTTEVKRLLDNSLSTRDKSAATVPGYKDSRTAGWLIANDTANGFSQADVENAKKTGTYWDGDIGELRKYIINYWSYIKKVSGKPSDWTYANAVLNSTDDVGLSGKALSACIYGVYRAIRARGRKLSGQQPAPPKPEPAKTDPMAETQLAATFKLMKELAAKGSPSATPEQNEQSRKSIAAEIEKLLQKAGRELTPEEQETLDQFNKALS